MTEEIEKYNCPNHYMINGLNTMNIITKIMENNSTTYKESWYLGNTLKYLVRYRHKNLVEDLEKAKDYLERLIDEVNRQQTTTTLITKINANSGDKEK